MNLNNIKTNFHGENGNKNPPKKGWSYKCFRLIELESVIQMGKKYFP